MPFGSETEPDAQASPAGQRAWAAAQSRFSRRMGLRVGLGASAGVLLSACGGNGKGKAHGSPTSVATVASASASPTAALSPTPLPVTPITSPGSAGTAAQSFGKLTVRDEPRPVYAGTPADSEVLRITRFEDLSNLSPTALAAYSPFAFIYDPLIWIDEVTLDPVPRLAAKWEVSADGRDYTLHLRADVTFHDGSPLSADDVVFALSAYRDDRASGVKSFFAMMTDTPHAVDAHTVSVTLSAPSAGFLANACNQFIFQRQQFADFWATNGTLTGYDVTKTPLIGTGPWQMTSVNADDGQLELTRNANYWINAPHFQRLTFRSIDAAANRLQLWRDGGTDLLWPLSPADIDNVQDDQDGWLYSAQAVAYMCAWFNFANPSQPVANLWQPKALRQALMHAIDRAKYSATVLRGFADTDAYGVVAQPWGYSADVTHYEHDPAKARALLQGLGWNTQGDQLVNAAGQPLKLTAIVSDLPQYPVDAIALSLKDDFAALGIEMTVEPLGAADYADALRTTRHFDLAFSSRILFAGFNEYSFLESASDMAVNPQGDNSGWHNADADRLLAAIRSAPDQAAQVEPLRQLQQVLADDLPALWLGFPRDLILARKNIAGFQPNPMWQYWNTWSLWREQ
jgi:peptide/nickel transport system substrate-binding protein